jgi:hypothetical protein
VEAFVVLQSTPTSQGFPTLVRSPYQAPPAPVQEAAPPSPDAVVLSDASPGVPPVFSYGRFALVGLAALAAFGGFVSSAAAQSPPAPTAVSRTAPAPTSVTRVQRNDAVTAATKRYLNDMVENNRIQQETLNTYGKSFQNNYNTLVRMEHRIVSNPDSLADPQVRAVYEKIQAALDSVQVYNDVQEDIVYSAGGGKTIETPDGTRIRIPEPSVKRVPRTSTDYSGSARMTDAAIEKIQKILHPTQ